MIQPNELHHMSHQSIDNSNHCASSASGFYGWRIVLAGTLIFFVSNGIGFYGHGVFLDPLRTLHGWSKGSVSSAVTLYFITAGVTGIFIGRQIDRFGPRPILIAGSVIVGIAFFLLSRITALWQLYGVYFLLALGWSGTSVMTVNALITNWFVRRRGQAMSITMTGMSVGGMVLVPFAAYLISRWGLGLALPCLGSMFILVIIPLALFVIRDKPADMGQVPDGKPRNRKEIGATDNALNLETQNRIWTRRQAMSTLSFWAIVAAFFLAISAQVAYLVHQISFLSATIGLVGAASAVSITAAASIGGRLLLGNFIDRTDNRHVTIGLFLMQAIAVFSLAHTSHIIALYLGTFAFGLTMGCILMMQSLIMAECFGMASFATVSGMAGVFVSSGAAVGPMLAGFIYDATQSYRTAFIIFAGVSILAIFAIIFAKPPKAA